MARKLRVGIIGLGWPGVEHLKGYLASGKAHVVAVCDLDDERRDRIAAEYRQVLARERFGFDPEAVGHLLDYLFSEGIAIVARPLPAIVPDPGDQPFWEAAVEAAAPLITGNLKHFPTDVCTDIEVLAPATFIKWWRTRRQ